MGLVAKLIRFTRAIRNGANVTDVKSDPGGRAIQTSEHFDTPGTDAHPLCNDTHYMGDAQGTGRYSSLGYVDPKNEQIAEPGEHRTYSRDPDNGQRIAQVWLKNDGTILIENENMTFTLSADGSIKGNNGSGFFELQAGGAFVVNGATIGTDGNVTTANGVSLDDHEHVGNLGSPTSEPIT